jgi:hypothetical protein
MTYSERVSVSLVIQHATRKRLLILLSTTCPAPPYFSKSYHKRNEFFLGGCKLLNTKCVMFLYNFYVINLSF